MAKNAGAILGQSSLEIWAGPEASIIRVGNRWRDQTSEQGGWDRFLKRVQLLATLGIKAIRMPVLWEHVSRFGWRYIDPVMQELRRLGIRPIAGLVHHGSGPAGFSLLSKQFAEGLATHARAVAERYPWVEDYTPVNEPLTTARFSCLYGHWYPHKKSESAFVRALLNELRATVRAMEEIRKIVPSARLVQTEDVGSTSGPPSLKGQWVFDTHRRWVSLDLLMGWVKPGHRMWGHFRWLGIPEHELQYFVDHPCPPDLIGVNYYVTSDRYIDDALECYHERIKVGGNGRQRYVDVEAVRVRKGLLGHEALLLQVWRRYQRPIAITEVHIGGPTEDQMRWLRDAWEGADRAQAKGVDVRAITVWSAFGAYDWNSLVRKRNGYYEHGLFELVGSEKVPRPTSLADMVKALASGQPYEHPALRERGWWQRHKIRIEHPRLRRPLPTDPDRL